MTVVLAVFALALGALLASFAGVISERLYTGDSFLHGRSRCNSCARTLGVLDLVPIISYLATGGRCRTCRTLLPLRYLLIECALALAFFFAALREGPTLALAALLATFFLLAIIVLYDLRHTVVPLPLALLLLLSSALYAYLHAPSFAVLGLSLMVAGVIGAAFFLLFALSGGRAMGLGDAPVALALSLLVGFPASVAGLMYSFWVGGVIGIVILVRTRKGHRMGIEVPFVPFLAIGYLLALFTPWNPFLF